MFDENFSLESFIIYCDKLLIATEKIDTRIIDLNFGKTMKLFHGSPNKFNVIRANSYNAGNRLTPQRTSSYWTNNFEYAAFWATSYLSFILKVDECIDINTMKVVLPGHYVVEKTGESLYDILHKTYKEHGLYVYEANVDIKHIGRGQCPINEYTVDIPIKPCKMYKLSWDYIQKFLIFTKDEAEYQHYLNTYTTRKSFTKNKLSLREKIIFGNTDRIVEKRSDFLYNVYGSDAFPELTTV